MNAVYRVIWNALKRTYVAVHEKTGTAQSRGSALTTAVKVAVVASVATASLVSHAVTTTTDDFYVGDPEAQTGSQPGYKGMVPDYVEGQQVYDDWLEDTTIAGTAKRVFVGSYMGIDLNGNEDGKIVLDGVEDMFAINSGTLAIHNAINGIANGVKPNIYVGMVSEGGPTEKGTFILENSKITINRLLTADVTEIDATSELNAEGGIILGASAGAVNSYIQNAGSIVTSSITQNVAESGPQGIRNTGSIAVTGSWDSNALITNSGNIKAGELVIRSGREALADGDVSEWNTNSGTIEADKLTIVDTTVYGSSAALDGKLRNEADGRIVVGNAETKNGIFTIGGDFVNAGEVEVNGDLSVAADGTFVGEAESKLNVTGALNLNGEATLAGEVSAKEMTVLNSAWRRNEETGNPSVSFRTYSDADITVGESLRVGLEGDRAACLENKVGRTIQVGNAESNNGNFLVEGDFRNRGTLNVHGNATVAEGAFYAANSTSGNIISGTLAVNGAMEVRTGGSVSADTITVGENGKLLLASRVNAEEMNWAGVLRITSNADLSFDTLRYTGADGNAVFGTGSGHLAVTNAEGVGMNLESLTVRAGGSVTEGASSIFSSVVKLEEGASLKASFSNEERTREINVVLAEGSHLILSGEADAVSLRTIESNGGTLTIDGKGQGGVRHVGVLVGNSTFENVIVSGGTDSNGVGRNIDIDVEPGSHWFDHTKITYKNSSTEEFALQDKGQFNTYVLSRGENLAAQNATANYFLQSAGATSNSYDVVDGSKLKVEVFDLSNGGIGKITLTDGTLEVGLDQLFTEVGRDGVLTGTDMADGSLVSIPLGGIQTIGDIRNGVRQVLDTTAHGNIAFTDTGWTQAALRDVTGKLTSAYGEVGTITFINGESEVESEGFTVTTANSLSTVNTHGLIFADTELVNRSAAEDTSTKITFGTTDAEEGNTVKGDFGFRSIAEATEAVIEGGRTLYLVGYTADGEGTKLLTNTNNGGRVEVKDGTLVLGGASAGTTYGKLADVVLSAEESAMRVQNGVFTVSNDVVGVEGSALTVKEGATLKTASLTRFAGMLDNHGTLLSSGDVSLTDAMNSGAIEADGTIRLTSSEGKTGQNSGTLKGLTAVELEGEWNNAGTISNEAEGGAVVHTNGKLINGGIISTKTANADVLQNTGSISVTESFVAASIENGTNGEITAETITVNGKLDNSGSIEAETMTAGADTVNRGKLIADSLAVTGEFDNAGNVEAAGLSAESLKNSGILSADEISVSEGTITNRAGGVLSVTGENGLNAEKVVNEGRVVVNADLSVQTLTNAQAAQLQAEGVIILANAFTNEGSLKAAGLEANNGFTNGGLAEVEALDVTGKLDNKAGAQLVVTGSEAIELSELANAGSLKTAGSLSAGALENAEGALLKVEGAVSVGSAGAENSGSIDAASLAVAGDIVNTGSIVVRGDVTAEGTLEDNSGLIRAASLSVDGASNSGTIELTGMLDAGADYAIANKGTIHASAIRSNGLVNEGKITLTADNAAYTVADGQTFVNKGTMSGLSLFTAETDAENNGTISAAVVKVADGAVLTNAEGAKLVNVEKLAVDGALDNLGEVTAKSVEVGEEGTIVQSESAVLIADDMKIANSTYTHLDGTVEIKNGITFTAEGPKTINVIGGTEFMLGNENVTDTTYNVTKRLTFGSEKGLAEKLAAGSEILTAKLEAASGVLTIEQAMTLGNGAFINIGVQSPAVRTFALRSAEPEASPTANLRAGADSLTVVDVGALDGTAVFTAAAEGLTADIDPSATLVLTRVENDGDVTILEGFDLSSNIGADGVWAGGWSGDGAIFVNDGSSLDYDIETRYENGNFVANLSIADVSTVYTGIAANKIADAAMKNRGEGADVLFIRDVIRDRDMSVDEKTKIINAVTQIASTVGAQANFLADSAALMTSVEERASVFNTEGTGLWVKVEGGKYAQDGLKLAGTGEAGYDASAFGFTFGADTSVRSDLVIGGAFSYLKGSADSEGDVLKADNDYDTFGIQGYAAWTPCETGRLIGDVGYFRTSNEVKQTIGLDGYKSAAADFDASALTFGIRAEGRFDVNGVSLVPHAGLRGIYTMNDKFTTKIDGKAAFASDIDDTFTVQMPIGVAVEKTMDVAGGWTITPSADFTVTPQFGDTEGKTIVTGIGAETSQSLKADIAGDVTIRTAFGLRAEKGNAELSAKYVFTGGDAGRKDHAFTFGVSYRF